MGRKKKTSNNLKARNKPTPAKNVAPPPIMTSLYMSKIDLALEEERRLVYYSDMKGVSELDLSTFIGNSDGKLVWDSSGFHKTTVKSQLINGHVLVAMLFRNDGRTVVESWINLDTRIHCDDEVLVYDPERERYGELVWPWTMQSYKVHPDYNESNPTTPNSFFSNALTSIALFGVAFLLWKYLGN